MRTAKSPAVRSAAAKELGSTKGKGRKKAPQPTTANTSDSIN